MSAEEPNLQELAGGCVYALLWLAVAMMLVVVVALAIGLVIAVIRAGSMSFEHVTTLIVISLLAACTYALGLAVSGFKGVPESSGKNGRGPPHAP